MSRLRALSRALLSVGTLASCLAVVLGSGVAVAASDGELWLGRANTATRTTTLTDTAGVPLSLRTRKGSAPLAVNSRVKVSNLDADLLDGLDARALQRRVVGSCASGSFVIAVSGSGSLRCRAETFSVVWQIATGASGNATLHHDGMTSVRNGPGDYTVTWSGFPGRALPYCTGIGRAAVMVNSRSAPDGTGNLRLSFDAADTEFTCALIGLTP
jgi:hypothetical protein